MCLRIPSDGNLEKMHIRAFPILLTSLTCKFTCVLVTEIITDCIQITISSYMAGVKVTNCTLFENLKFIIEIVTI
jgi:hypothetical protein